MQYLICIHILMLCIVLFFFVHFMVDPFASTNPTDPNQQANISKTSSNDVFGGVPDIFADMAATAFQPIDPETGRPTEHTAETLDPFLRDDLTDSSTINFSPSPVSDDIMPSKSSEELIEKEQVPEFSDMSGDVSNDLHVPQDPITQEEQKMSELVQEPSVPEMMPEQNEQVMDTEVPSYFETAVSFDAEPISSQSDNINVAENSPSFVQPSQTSTSSISDHYDPFVDSVTDDSVPHSVDSDDPFLQDIDINQEINRSVPTLTSDVVIDPFLQDDFSLSTDDVSTPDQSIPASSIDEQAFSPVEEPIESPSIAISTLPEQSDVVEEQNAIDQSDSSVSWSEPDYFSPQVTSEQENVLSDEIVPPEDTSVSEEIITDWDISDTIEQATQSPQEELFTDEKNINVTEEPMDDVDKLPSFSNESPSQPELSVEPELLVASELSLGDEMSVSPSVDSDETTVSEPSMVQWLVEGMFDPFMSTKLSPNESIEDEVATDDPSINQPIKDKILESVAHGEDQEDIIPWVIDTTIQEDVVDENVSEEAIEDPIVSEPTVVEEEQDMQKTWLSDMFVKFQELLQRIYRVHDDRGWHDAFTVVWADNDALYITYTFAIEASIDQAIIITKESTDRKDSDAIDTHVLRFAINTNSLVEVYVDGVLLFVEDQLVDNVKSKMQLMDKFNKFIFLIDQFIEDAANQISWDAIVSAQEEFGGF